MRVVNAVVIIIVVFVILCAITRSPSLAQLFPATKPAARMVQPNARVSHHMSPLSTPIRLILPVSHRSLTPLSASSNKRSTPHPFNSLPQSTPVTDDDALATAIRAALENGAGLITNRALLSDNMTLTMDLNTFRGATEYNDLSFFWRRRAKEEMPEIRWYITQIQRVGPSQVMAQWTAYWIPQRMQWLVSLGRAWPGVRLEWFDLLDRIGDRSQFSWAAVRQLFWTAATKGVMRLPVAAMPGTTTFDFDAAGKVVSQREALPLVQALKRGEVQNKRVARDVMDFMIDVRQPPSMRYDDWDRRVCQELNINQVPGMRPLDVDGLEPETQSQFIEDVSVVLSFGIVVVLTFGVASGYLYYQTIQERAQMMQRFLDSDEVDGDYATLLRSDDGDGGKLPTTPRRDKVSDADPTYE